MATIFSLGPAGKDGLCPVKVRVQARVPRVDVKQNTPLRVAAKVWNSDPGSLERRKFCNNPEIRKLFAAVEEIQTAIYSKLEAGIALTAEDVREIVNSIVFMEERAKAEAEKAEKARLEELANKVTLDQFLTTYCADIKSGKRLNDKGQRFSDTTVRSIKYICGRFFSFEKHMKRNYDFEDMDLNFYREYTAYLNGLNFSANTTGKCINLLKTILAIADSEGYGVNGAFKDKRFKGKRVEVDNIYLTNEDLDKFRAVDLSKKTYGYDLARDIFMIGVWTAQRISDYNNIKREDIETKHVRYIEDVPAEDGSGKLVPTICEKDVTIIYIRQKKTGAKVAIPCSTELKRILEKYDYNIPHLSDQNINDNIKEIAKEAGLTEQVKITSIKGGRNITEMIPKYQLVCSHTARRTGATLMYLSGMDVFDIMKVTGHSSPQMLKKYIKADELEVVEKLIGKYNYFD